MLTHAWLEQRNRKTVELENGETGILVTSEDYRAAYKVFSKACQRSVVELSETHRKILNAIYRLEKKDKRKLGGAGFSLRKIADEAEISYETVRKQKAFLVQSVQLLREPPEGGLLLVKDADPSWWAAGEVLEGFPTPAQVKSWWESENQVDIVDSTEKEVEKAIDKPNPNGKSPVSTMSSRFEGLGEKVDYEYSEDE